jgi:hypothetical protein
MKNLYTTSIILILFLASILHVNAQSFNINWDNTIGGGDTDELYDMASTNDGGYILAGESSSDAGNDKSEDNYGGTDGWVVKVDAMGEVEWDATIGDDNYERIHSISQTADGGYIFTGFGVGPDDSRGYGDYWVVKLESTGQVAWDTLYGTDARETGISIMQTSDDGFIVGGTRKAEDFSYVDLWVFKLDANGDIQWEQTYDNANAEDELTGMDTTSDGGYIIGAVSVDENKEDYWTLKIDENGTVEWDTVFGGAEDDRLHVVRQTMDGGFILGGYSESMANEYKSEDCGKPCFWVVKTDASGNITWENSIGGDGTDLLHALELTSDGGYILGGSIASNASIHTDVSEYGLGETDYWFVKIDDAGNVLWDKRLGGEERDYLHDVIQVEENIYVLAGFSSSGESEYKSEANLDSGGGGFGIDAGGSQDFWVLELETGPDFLELTSPNGGEVWDKADDVTVTWETSLPNGPGIEYELFYSVDGGATFEEWYTLDDNYETALLSIPFGWEPGDNYVVKITSNGLEDVSDGTFEITDSQATSVTMIEERAIDLYPGPADNQLHVSIKKGRQAEIFIYTLRGTLVSGHIIKEKAVLDVSQYKPGLYMYMVKQDDTPIQTGKLVIE